MPDRDEGAPAGADALPPCAAAIGLVEGPVMAAFERAAAAYRVSLFVCQMLVTNVRIEA